MTMIRSLVERLAHGVVLKRRLPPVFGRTPLYVSPEAGLRYFRWNLAKVDPVLLRVARELVNEGDVVWDIGANVGLFSFAAAALAGDRGRVVAVEPDTWLVQLLHHSAARKHIGSAPVTVLQAAVSDKVGVASFDIAARSRSCNSLSGFGMSQKGGIREVQNVVTVSLDWLLACFPPPTVVKIDVEGAELLVLRGAPRLLRELRPKIFCEVAEENSLEVANLLRSNNYHFWDGEHSADNNGQQTAAPYNTIAIADFVTSGVCKSVSALRH